MPRVALLSLVLACAAAFLGGCRALQPEEIVAPHGPDVASERALALGPAPDIGPVTFAGQRFTVCTVNLDKLDLELFWRNDAKQPFNGFKALDDWLWTKGRRLVFAMNAGMYQEDFSPCGLYVEKGEELRPLNLADGSGNFCLKPNGVFMVTDRGAAVVESSTYPDIKDDTLLATQSGPMLVIDGKLHPEFGADSTSRLYRNGVGVVDPRTVVFAISEEPVNFHEFAVFFRDHLKCGNALYLDGTVSSLYSTTLGRCDQTASLGPIIAVTQELQ